MTPPALPPADIDIVDLNIAQPEIFQAGLAHAFFTRLRNEAPVHFCPCGRFGPYWSITRFADIEAIEEQTEIFSSDHRLGGITIGGEPGMPGLYPMFIASDPPEHRIQRRAIMPAFSPTQTDGLADLIRARAAAILDAVPIGETFDWVTQVSIELTAMTLATLFDFPQEHRWQLIRWSTAITALPGGPHAPTMEEKLAIMNEGFEALEAIWRRRRDEPPAGDLISMLAHGADTRDMTREQFRGSMMLLIVGGNETTRNSISGSVVALSRFPDQFDKLRDDPTLVASMASEAVRWQSPAAHMRRTATRDVWFNGQHIRQGDKVILWYVSANRDESVIDRPDDFVINRPNPRRHLAFGHGIHRCIGARLAEMQIRIVWEEILQRFRTIALVGEPVRSYSTIIHGYDRLPVMVR
jgi:cytochrome P450